MHGHFCSKCIPLVENERIEQNRINDQERWKKRERVHSEARVYYQSIYGGKRLPNVGYDSVFPKRFELKSIDDFDREGNTDSIDEAIRAINSKQSVFISGECGRGKTHLAVALARIWWLGNMPLIDSQSSSGRPEIDKYGLPLFLPSVELFLELKASFDSKHDSEEAVIRKYADHLFLVIDDVGSEKVSDWSRQMFYTLIDRRYRDMKQTIITSNLSLGELAKQIDARISSRILEMGIAIELKGKDKRIERSRKAEGKV